MHENRCGSCRWFDSDHKHYKLNPGFGICDRVEDISDSRSEMVDPDDVDVFVASTGGALFICKPSFGCVLWETKEASNG